METQHALRYSVHHLPSRACDCLLSDGNSELVPCHELSKGRHHARDFAGTPPHPGAEIKALDVQTLDYPALPRPSW